MSLSGDLDWSSRRDPARSAALSAVSASTAAVQFGWWHFQQHFDQLVMLKLRGLG